MSSLSCYSNVNSDWTFSCIQTCSPCG